jgi:hypothetical protein
MSRAGRKEEVMAVLWAVFAQGAGNWEYEMVWGSPLSVAEDRRVFRTRAEAEEQAERMQARVENDPDAPVELRYVVVAVEPDDEIDDRTAADHIEAWEPRKRG